MKLRSAQEPLRISKIFLSPFNFYIGSVSNEHAASRKIDRNCLIFADCRREMLLNFHEQLLGIAKSA
jgi:hypothetical protein